MSTGYRKMLGLHRLAERATSTVAEAAAGAKAGGVAEAAAAAKGQRGKVSH